MISWNQTDKFHRSSSHFFHDIGKKDLWIVLNPEKKSEKTNRSLNLSPSFGQRKSKIPISVEGKKEKIWSPQVKKKGII
jgi:hypothetical protein